MGHCECHTNWDCGKRATPAEEAYGILQQWVDYVNTLLQAGLIECPQQLYGRTVGWLDANSV